MLVVKSVLGHERDGLGHARLIESDLEIVLVLDRDTSPLLGPTPRPIVDIELNALAVGGAAGTASVDPRMLRLPTLHVRHSDLLALLQRGQTRGAVEL